MARLIHLNGAPGVGKSTLARRYVADHPGALNCDVDVLRSLVGGWQDDFLGVGAILRPTVLAMITSHLDGDRDVVLPHLLAAPSEVARFEAAALEVGASFVERVLLDPDGDVVARFHRRGAGEPGEVWHEQVRAVAASNGGDEMLQRSDHAVRRLLDRRPGARAVASVEGDPEGTYRRLLDSLR